VQGTESDELGAETRRPSGPILLPQIIEQRQALFEFFEILAHGAVWPPETSVGEADQRSKARMVGKRKNLSEAQGPEDLQKRSQLGQWPSPAIGLVPARQPTSDAGDRLA
jgi:hypothetical protein